jgi:hypothetical protein
VNREQTENRDLLARLASPPVPSPAHDEPLMLPPSSLLIVRRSLERDLDGGFSPINIQADATPSAPVLRAGNRNFAINQ